MPTIFSRPRDRREELYIRPSLTRIPRTESIDSFATAPNLPGAGRTLGLLYDAAGSGVERLLNKAALRYGLGPQALVEQIRSSRPVTEGRWGYPWQRPAPTEKQRKYLENKCRKLLSYCKSHILETQLQALDAVTTLAIEDPFIRRVLGDVLNQSYLIPKYREDELYIASSKALMSIKENEVYDFCLRFTNECARLKRREITLDDPELDSFKGQLELLFNDPDISFLLGRILLVGYGLDYGMHDLLYGTYFDIATTKPHVIEWVTLREAYTSGILSPLVKGLELDGIMSLAQHFPVLQLYQTRFTSVRDLHRPIDSSDPVDLEALFKESHYVVFLLNTVCGTKDLKEQLLFLRNADEKTRKLFEGTVFGNEILIAWAYVHHQNVCELCPVQVMQDETGIAVMLSYFFRGNETERALAEMVISLSLQTSRYCKQKLVKLVYRFMENTHTHSLDISSLSRTFRRLPSLPLDDDRIRIRDRASFKNCDITPADQTMDMYPDDVLYCRFEVWTWLEVNGEEHPFDTTGHFPVLAGFDASGKELYVADVNYHSVYVSSGTREVTYCSNSGEVKTSSRFQVMVLSHDPCDVGLEEIPEGAKFQTGSAFWLRETENASITEMTDSMITLVGGSDEELKSKDIDRRDSGPSKIGIQDGYTEEMKSELEQNITRIHNSTMLLTGDNFELDFVSSETVINGVGGWVAEPSQGLRDEGHERGTVSHSEGILVRTDDTTASSESSTINGVVEFEADVKKESVLAGMRDQNKSAMEGSEVSKVILQIRQLVEVERRQLEAEKQFLEYKLRNFEERERELKILEAIESNKSP